MDDIDIQKYAKKWYEVARFPTLWESGYARDVTATYTWVPNPSDHFGGRLKIHNEMIVRGQKHFIDGTAVVPFTSDKNTRLAVYFEPNVTAPIINPFPGAYYIIMIDRLHYSWAVVSEPTRRHLWILSDKPYLPDSTIGMIVYGLINDLGFTRYEVSRLIKTPQSEAIVAVPARGVYSYPTRESNPIVATVPAPTLAQRESRPDEPRLYL